MFSHSVCRRAASSALFSVLTAGVVIAAVPLPASAQQDYPNRPIRLIVGVPPGGTIDVVARIVGAQLSKQLKQTVLVDNKGGAGGNIGANFVAKSPPDGYTLFLSVIGTMAINPSLYKSLPFDPLKDFAPISQLTSVPQIMVINPSVPANNLEEFIAYEKKHHGQLNFASGGVGTATELAGDLFNSMAGTKLIHVPYKGSGPAMVDLLAGRASVMFEQMSTALPHVRAHALRALGVTTLKRSPAAPDIPSLAEAGLQGYDVSTWHGLVAPAGTPPAIINRLHDEVVTALASPAVQKSFSEGGIIAVSSTPEQFAAYTKSELIRWRAIVKATGVTLE